MRPFADRKQLRPVGEERFLTGWSKLIGSREERRVDARIAVRIRRQILPDLIGQEAEDRRDQPRERFGDLPQHGLRCTACRAVGREGVEAVLEHVEHRAR